MSSKLEQRLETERLKARVEVLERRNAALRQSLELAVHGQQPAWTAFQEASLGVFGDGRMVGVEGNLRTYLNSRYQVSVFNPDEHSPLMHLSIKRCDGAAVRDWRDMQRIKNELLGPEWEGVELYPAESRLTDGANQYHLWCIEGQFPLGFGSRLVSEDNTHGVTQRPWPDGERPSDLSSVTAEQMAKAAGLED
jgi:hypothetical protein